MTTAATKKQAPVLEYDLTVGLSAMEGRGFYYPTDTAVAPNGRLYVPNRSVDGATRGIRVTVCDIDSEYYGTFGYFGHDPGEFVWASGITADGEGRLFISDEYANRVTVFDLDGNYQSSWGTTGSGEGQLDGPSGLAIGADGSVYVADTHNHRVQRFTPSGVFLACFRLARDRRRRVRSALGPDRRPHRRRLCSGLGQRPDPEVHGRRRVRSIIRLVRHV